jgi:hypothetical protein
MEFDFIIEYKQGSDNVAADALSRLKCASLVTLEPASDLLNQIKASWQEDADLQKLITEIQQDPSSHRHYSWARGELRRKGRLVIGGNEELRKQILAWLHSSACGGHLGRDATLQRVKAVVYWKGLSKEVKRFVHQCGTCQKCKYDNAASLGLLQPLPVPGVIWQHVTVEFIEGLLNSYGKQVIFVVVDKLSKAAHFMSL